MVQASCTPLTKSSTVQDKRTLCKGGESGECVQTWCGNREQEPVVLKLQAYHWCIETNGYVETAYYHS